MAYHAWVQNTIESGWYETGDRLAAPFVQNNHPFTVTDEFLYAAIGRVLAPLLGSAGAAVTWWVVLSFPLAAITAVGLARYLRLSPVASVVPGVAFALLPDHFLRGMGHINLATTWVIPLGMLAAVSLVHPPRVTGRRRVLFGGRRAHRVRHHLAGQRVLRGLRPAARRRGWDRRPRRHPGLALSAGRRRSRPQPESPAPAGWMG